MDCILNNLTKEELIKQINLLFIDIQKKYKIPKKYWLNPITNIKLNEVNYYSTISDKTLVLLTKGCVDLYIQCKPKKPLLYAVVITDINPDSTINAKIIWTVKSKTLTISKYKGVNNLFMFYSSLEDRYLHPQYKQLCERYEERWWKYNNKKIYELKDQIIERTYENNVRINIKITTSEADEYNFIEVFICDKNNKKTVYMGRVFYNKNTLNELIYITIKEGLENLRITSNSKINIGEAMLKIKAFSHTLKENPNKKLNLRSICLNPMLI